MSEDLMLSEGRGGIGRGGAPQQFRKRPTSAKQADSLSVPKGEEHVDAVEGADADSKEKVKKCGCIIS